MRKRKILEMSVFPLGDFSYTLSFSLPLSFFFLLFITAHSLSFVQSNRKKRLREYAIQGITGVGLFQNRNFVRLLLDSVHSFCTHAHKRFVDTLRNRRRKSSLSHLIRSESITRFDSIRFVSIRGSILI